MEVHNPFDMMAAIKRRIDENRGEKEELIFFRQSYQYLFATHHQVDIKPWTIGRLEVEFDEIVGVGGL